MSVIFKVQNVLHFMIVGVQKSGTTALSYFLDQHPQLRIAKGKEVHLFDSLDFDGSWSPSEINAIYSKYFSEDEKGKILGEATPIYIYWPEIASQLKKYNPNLKLILILRDPVERALSQYLMTKQRGQDGRSFGVALVLEWWRLLRDKRRVGGKRNGLSSSRNRSYVDRGLYDRQLKNLRANFPDNQIFVVDNSELMLEHHKTLQKIFSFLGVDENVLIDSARHFSGDYSDVSHPFCEKILRWRFKCENARLKRQLKEMGYSPVWPWIN